MFLQLSKSPDYPEYFYVKIPASMLRWDKKWHLTSLYLARTQARLTVGFYSVINLYLLAWSSKTLIFYNTEEEISSLIIA